jgi:hypothetical protein
MKILSIMVFFLVIFHFLTLRFPCSFEKRIYNKFNDFLWLLKFIEVKNLFNLQLRFFFNVFLLKSVICKLVEISPRGMVD